MRFLKYFVVVCLMLAASFSRASDDGGHPEKPSEWKQDSYQHLRKMVGLTRFQNKSSLLDDRLVSAIDDTLAAVLTEKCPENIPVRNDHPIFLELRNRQPRRVSGEIDNMTLIRTGRAAGLNAVVAGEIMDIRHFQEEMGYWWFKNMISFFEVHLHCSVYDTETGAKLLDMTVSEKTDLPEELYRQVESGDYAGAFPEIQRISVSLAEKIGEEICTKMEEELFKSFVTEIDGRQVVVTSGSNAGIRPGDLLAIHDSGRVIIGKDEHQFFIAGLKTGVLRIDTVADDSAEGSIVQGEMAGKDVCLKPIVEPSWFSNFF
ncbi:MAG: hypothetical protein C4522_02495 [Desulfobacteraceae bacterium]|nr:MAG: hypothetical protein C4522_02495 [Desulfobacteraceae bacterium]